MRVEKLKVDRFSLGTLMQDMQRGRIRVPRFQREFVWERKRIVTLFDSMFREYPIGTIFLWDAPSEYNHLFRDVEDLQQPPLEKKQGYRFILDGQQRLTSLYAVVRGLTIEGEDYSKIVVDLDNTDPDRMSFQYRKPDNQRWVSVCDLLSEEIFAIYNGLDTDERRQHFEMYRTALNNYPFSVVIVSDDMLIEEAIEIFERINRQGRRLTRYDLISASVLKGDFDLRERVKQDIVDKLSDFGEIEDTSIPQALALNIKGNTEHSTQLSLKTEDVQNVWESTVECFLLAVDFVRGNLGVARKDFLPYDAMLPVLAHYFFVTNSSSVMSIEHREQLEYWFWRVAFSERYGGNSQTRMSVDAAWIRRLVEDGEPYNQPISIDIDALTDSSMRSTRSAVRNGVLCLLKLRRPLHFTNGAEIEIGNDHFSRFTRAERHHIFPVGFLKSQGYDNLKWVHLVPNFCFIPAGLNRWISDKAPSDYMTEIACQYDDQLEFEKIMRTHLIPVDDASGIWTDDYELFLRQRARLLVDEIRWRCGITTQLEPEQRNPVLDVIEEALRDFIHDILLTHGPGYWKHNIPGDIQKAVSKKIDNYARKSMGVAKEQFQDPRSRLDFCDVSDYSKIILSKGNWALFGPVLKDRTECQRVLDDFREFRNAVKHGREVDSLLDHRFQAAAIWLSQALEIDLGVYGM